MYCLKFVDSMNCSYCIKGAFTKTICASGTLIKATFFLTERAFSFRFQVCILFSCLFSRQSLFCRSLKGTLGEFYIQTFVGAVPNLSILSSMLLSVILSVSLLLSFYWRRRGRLRAFDYKKNVFGFF